jgi:hypothetical protein
VDKGKQKYPKFAAQLGQTLKKKKTRAEIYWTFAKNPEAIFQKWISLLAKLAN